MKVVHLHSVGSTQDECFRLLRDGEPVAVRADVQTAGRGRFGRLWHSPPGGLWLSIGLVDVDGLACSLAGPVAVCRTVTRFIPRKAVIHPPNDVILDQRKLAGVLVEVRGNLVVTGFGLNVYQEVFPEDIKAISLVQAGGEGFNLDLLANGLMGDFADLLAGGMAGLLGAYQENLGPLGKEVVVNGTRGVLSSVSERGFLVGERTIGFGEFSGMEVVG